MFKKKIVYFKSESFNVTQTTDQVRLPFNQ